jgi:hypothetical protein
MIWYDLVLRWGQGARNSFGSGYFGQGPVWEMKE